MSQKNLKLDGATRHSDGGFVFSPDSLSSIRVDEQATRWVPDGDQSYGLAQDDIEQMANDINDLGYQLTAVEMRMDGGEPVIYNGRLRLAGLKLINSQLATYSREDAPFGLRAVVNQSITEEQAIAASLTANQQRPLTPMDLVKSAVKMNQQGMDNAGIARKMTAIGMKVTGLRVKNLLALGHLPLAAQKLLHRGKLFESAALKMLELQLPVEELMRFAEDIESGKQRTSVLTHLVN